MITVLASIVGALLGSMMSVIVARWPVLEGFATGRSRCPHCMHALSWQDLVPVVSWLVSGGACRYCKAPISLRYPAYEVVMAFVFGLYAYTHGVPSPWVLLEYAILFGLVMLFFFDLYERILPDVVVASLGAVVLVRLVAYRPDQLLNAGAMALGLGAFFGLLYAVSQGRWLGMGDVKFAPVVGLLFGFPIAIGVTVLSVWLGALVGIGLIVTKRAHLGSELPFGSFWTAVCVMVLIAPGPAAFLAGLITPVF